MTIENAISILEAGRPNGTREFNDAVECATGVMKCHMEAQEWEVKIITKDFLIGEGWERGCDENLFFLRIDDAGCGVGCFLEYRTDNQCFFINDALIPQPIGNILQYKLIMCALGIFWTKSKPCTLLLMGLGSDRFFHLGKITAATMLGAHLKAYQSDLKGGDFTEEEIEAAKKYSTSVMHDGEVVVNEEIFTAFLAGIGFLKEGIV